MPERDFGAPQRSMLIGGEWVQAKDGGTWDLVDPGSEEVVEQVAYGGADDVFTAIDAAQAAFPGWANLTAYQRGAVLEKAADWIGAHVGDLALITTEESGKPLGDSKGEWLSAASYLRWFAGEGVRAYGRIVPPSAPKRDRKSTRLNSSHVKISYAVFCLKKKKKRPNKDDQEPAARDPAASARARTTARPDERA